ncbi:MAG TPA: amidohydrolase family protein [Anaerovoracaceae bacterium]|nr:amidohydrolase family protein [Anaerovoracaceae bacterium]
MIIDGHVHIGKFMCGKLTMSNDFESALEMADRNGIDKIFCTSTTSLAYDFETGDRQILEGMRKYPDKVLAYATIPSPRHGKKIIEHLKRCFLEYGFHGLKIYSHTQGIGSYESYISIADEYMDPVLEFAAEHNIPVLAHSSPEQCDVVCGRFPELQLMMAHMGSTQIAHGMWHTAIAVAKRRPRLILDTTSSGMDLGMVEEAVRVIGDERIIWGSDVPLLSVAYNIVKVTSAEIPQESKAKILGLNIARLVSGVKR